MEVLRFVSVILMAALEAYYAWLLLCNIIGIFCKKKQYPAAEPFRIAVMICARNEENVIGNLLDSLYRQDYPADKMKVFVIAHNCTDKTACIAREWGATVFERNDPAETFKGHALHYGVERLKTLYPDTFDALCVFDADNVAGRTFLKEMNAALHSDADVVQGFRNSKNYHESAVSELFGAYWYQIMLSQNLPHSAMGLPSTIGGTGFAVKMDALADGWETYTMLEDIEFTCQMVLAGKKCTIAPYAMFYDEQPTTFKVGMRQRYRWSVGGYQVLKQYLPKMFRAIHKRGAKAVKMIVDLLVNPVMLISLCGFVMRIMSVLLTGDVLGLALFLLGVIGLVWICVFPATMVMLLRQRMNPLKNLWTILLFPYFLLISMLFAVPALFDRNPKWKPIPHTDKTTIETIEKTA